MGGERIKSVIDEIFICFGAYTLFERPMDLNKFTGLRLAVNSPVRPQPETRIGIEDRK